MTGAFRCTAGDRRFRPPLRNRDTRRRDLTGENTRPAPGKIAGIEERKLMPLDDGFEPTAIDALFENLRATQGEGRLTGSQAELRQGI